AEEKEEEEKEEEEKEEEEGRKIMKKIKKASQKPKIKI
ncbi:MAG: chromosomal replication initiator DnaA, partial [Thermoplasmata archaeon]